MKEFKNHTFVVCAYKESEYLEKTIESLEKQIVKSNIIISTSTPNTYIEEIAKKHNLKLFINNKCEGIGPDWNFALSCAQTQYVTLAHQDDLYDLHYTEEIQRSVKKYKDIIMLFTNYKEIRNNVIVRKNFNLIIKSIMLIPIMIFKKSKWAKMIILRFGNPICCPSVCLNVNKTGIKAFKEDMKSNIDWGTWIELANQKGAFIYLKKALTFHRIHINSETSKCIENNERIKEDYEIFCRLWPKWFAKFIMIFYKHAQDLNI